MTGGASHHQSCMTSDCEATRQGRTDAGIGSGGEGERDPAAAGRLQREAQRACAAVNGKVKPHAGGQLARGGRAGVRRTAAGGHAAGAAAGGGAREPPIRQQQCDAHQQLTQRGATVRTHCRQAPARRRARCLRAWIQAAQGVCHVSRRRTSFVALGREPDRPAARLCNSRFTTFMHVIAASHVSSAYHSKRSVHCGGHAS